MLKNMRRVRAYSREDRKRLIIHGLAQDIRTGDRVEHTCAMIARKMDIVPSTKLRDILNEMVFEGTLTAIDQPDAGIAGFRRVYSLNTENDAYSVQHTNAKSARRSIALHSSKGTEEVFFS